MVECEKYVASLILTFSLRKCLLGCFRLRKMTGVKTDVLLLNVVRRMLGQRKVCVITSQWWQPKTNKNITENLNSFLAKDKHLRMLTLSWRRQQGQGRRGRKAGSLFPNFGRQFIEPLRKNCHEHVKAKYLFEQAILAPFTLFFWLRS